MKTKQQIAAQVTALIDSGIALTKSLQATQADILACVEGKPLDAAWAFVGEAVVPPIAKKYGAVARQTKTGTWTLDRKDGTRHDTAYSFLRSLLARTNLLAGSGRTHKGANRHKSEPAITPHRDFVLKSFKLLSVADRKWVIKQLGL